MIMNIITINGVKVSKLTQPLTVFAFSQVIWLSASATSLMWQFHFNLFL